MTPVNGGRYCVMHRTRLKRWGSLDGTSPKTPEHYAILSRVIRTEGCWKWDGYHATECGYAVWQGAAGNRRRAVHRIIYSYYYGDIPDGLQIDHMCGNRSCINPEHLRALTPKGNTEHFVKELRRSNTSGVRGVTYDKARRRWRARVESAGKARASYHISKDEAAEAVLKMRLDMHTHNDRDRVKLTEQY